MSKGTVDTVMKFFLAQIHNAWHWRTALFKAIKPYKERSSSKLVYDLTLHNSPLYTISQRNESDFQKEIITALSAPPSITITLAKSSCALRAGLIFLF